MSTGSGIDIAVGGHMAEGIGGGGVRLGKDTMGGGGGG
jgi:hypothetical protein